MLLPETLSLHSKLDFEFHYVYFLPWKDQMVEGIERAGGKVVCFKANNNIQLLRRAGEISKYVRDFKIDLIHSHLPWAGVVARIVGKRTGIPVIYTEHNKQERYHFATRFLNLRTLNWLSRIIAVSNDVEESIRKFKPTVEPQIQTILNGVNTVKFAPDFEKVHDLRASLGIPANAPVVGTIAVFRFQKRLAHWISVALEIKKEMPAAHFVIVGDGPLRDELYKVRSELKLGDSLHFPGLQAEVRPYLAEFDVYMMSSIFEGLPIALLEAMSMGIPVVSTSAGGIKEVISHEKDGLLVDVDRWDLLAKGVISLLRNSEKRSQLGAAGRNRVIKCFSMERMVNALEDTYRQVSLERRSV